MYRICAPLDEERQQPITVIFQAEGLPPQYLSVRAGARAIPGRININPGCSRFLSQRSKIVGVNSPRNELRLFEAEQLLHHRTGLPRRFSLLRIGRHDFQIAVDPKRKQRVAGAASGMHAPKSSTDAAALFHPADSAVEIRGTQNDVV